MKKLTKFVLISALLTMFTLNVSAAMLMQYTPTTYVESTHPNIWKYVGNVSVKGADWIRVDGNSWFYPTFSRITYRVPNFLGSTISGYQDYPKTVYSIGKNDNIQRKGTITVMDSINPINGKTQVFWNIGLANRGVQPGDPEPWRAETKLSGLE